MTCDSLSGNIEDGKIIVGVSQLHVQNLAGTWNLDTTPTWIWPDSDLTEYNYFAMTIDLAGPQLIMKDLR